MYKNIILEIKEPYLKGVFRILSIIKDVAFCKIITDEIPLTIFAKRLILDIWQGSGYTSDLSNSLWSKVFNCQIEKLLQEIIITLKLVTVSCFGKDAGLLLTLKRLDRGGGGGGVNLTPLPVIFEKMHFSERVYFWYYHKSHLFWKFYWNFSNRSEDTKIFFFHINYFRQSFGFFDISCYEETNGGNIYQMESAFFLPSSYFKNAV